MIIILYNNLNCKGGDFKIFFCYFNMFFLYLVFWNDKKPMEILPNLKANGMYETMVHRRLLWIKVCSINHIGLLILFCVILGKCGQ